MSEKRIPIYYEYIEVNDKLFHSVKVDNEGFKFLIPGKYTINYSKSVNDYKGIGHIYFNHERNNYKLDYYEESNDKFNNVHKEYRRKFKNYNNIDFIEEYVDDAEYLYMNYKGYTLVITGSHKLSITEYFDMYLILFSITDISSDLKALTDALILDDMGIVKYSNGVDLLVANLNVYHKDLSDIKVMKDDEYLKYKEKDKNISDISTNLVDKTTEKTLKFVIKDNKWTLKGSLDFDILGKYREGTLDEYSEITESNEFEEKEKIDLMNTMLNQKQLEINSNKEAIRDIFYSYLYEYIEEKLDFDDWERYHLNEFVRVNVLNPSLEEVSSIDLFDMFKNKVTRDNIIDLLDSNSIKNSSKGEYIVLYPDRYELTLSTMNYFISSIKLCISEDFHIKKDN